MLIELTCVDSTNKYALANFDTLRDRTVISAETQTAGYGRLGRNWLSPPGANIYCSIVLKEQNHNPFLAVLGALAAAQTIRNYHLPAQIKWPNDVLIHGKKIGGVLAQSNNKGTVLGLGININMPAETLVKIDKPATSLLAETGQTYDKAKILREILEKFFVLYDQAQAEGFAKLLEVWQNELHIIGRKIRIQTVGKEVHGTVIQVDKDGALIVETAQGKERVLTGDVYVI